MPSVAVSDRESFWRSVISRRDDLQLTVAEVCEQADVSPASFYQWQRKLRAMGHRRGRKASPAATPLVPVRIIEDRSSELALELPRGLRLHIPAGCDEATLQRVLRVALAASQEAQPC
jgi:transposase-like protein